MDAKKSLRNAKTQQKVIIDKNEYGHSPSPKERNGKKMPADIHSAPRQSGKLHYHHEKRRRRRSTMQTTGQICNLQLCRKIYNTCVQPETGVRETSWASRRSILHPQLAAIATSKFPKDGGVISEKRGLSRTLPRSEERSDQRSTSQKRKK